MDEVLDIGVLFSPHVESSFLEERFLLGVVQSPHQGVIPKFRIFLSVVENREELIAEAKLVFTEERFKSTHGGITNSAVLVLVLNNLDQNVGGSGMVNVLQGDDGLSLFLEVSGGVDLVGEDLDVFVQKTRFLTTGFFASASEKGGESEFDDAVTMSGGLLGEKWLEFLKKVFSWVTDVVSHWTNNTCDDQGFVGVLNDVTNDKSGWSSSGNDQSI